MAIKPQHPEMDAWLKANALTYTRRQLVDELKTRFGFETNTNALRQRESTLGIIRDSETEKKRGLGNKQKLKAEPTFDEVREEHGIRRAHTRTTKNLSHALEQLKVLEAHVEGIKRLQASEEAYAIQPRHSTGTSEATAIAVASDWHCGATVKPIQVSGLNEFNVAIFKERAATFFERVVRLTRKERQDVHIEELVLFLGGDLIDGALHLDTIMSNEIAGPMAQAVVCQASIQGGLNYLREHGEFKKITVVCCDGNHGRVSQRQHWASRQGNALEFYMYHNLAALNTDLTWVIADGIHVYLPIYNNVIRFMHGDTIAFGGVNGPYTYLNRRIYQWDQARRADFTVQGHLHFYCIGGRRWLINGSLIGHNDYSISLGGEFQPPIQAYLLWDKRRGPTVNIPILL